MAFSPILIPLPILNPTSTSTHLRDTHQNTHGNLQPVAPHSLTLCQVFSPLATSPFKTLWTDVSTTPFIMSSCLWHISNQHHQPFPFMETSAISNSHYHLTHKIQIISFFPIWSVGGLIPYSWVHYWSFQFIPITIWQTIILPIPFHYYGLLGYFFFS